MPKPETMSGMEEDLKAKPEGAESRGKTQTLEEAGRARLQRGLGRVSESGKKVSEWFSRLKNRAIGGVKEAGTMIGRTAGNIKEAGMATGRAVVGGAAEAGKAVGRGAERGVALAAAAPEAASMVKDYASKKGTEAADAARDVVQRGKEMGVSAYETSAAFVEEKKDALVNRGQEAYTGLVGKVNDAKTWAREQKQSVVDQWHARQEAKAAAERVKQMEELRARREKSIEEFHSTTNLMNELQIQITQSSLRTEAAAA